MDNNREYLNSITRRFSPAWRQPQYPGIPVAEEVNPPVDAFLLAANGGVPSTNMTNVNAKPPLSGQSTLLKEGNLAWEKQVTGQAPKKTVTPPKKTKPTTPVKAATTAPKAPVKQATPGIEGVESMKTTPGSVMSIPTDYSETKTESSTGTESRTGGWVNDARNQAKDLSESLKRGEQGKADIDTAYGTDAQRLGQLKDATSKYKTDVATRLSNYTNQMDTNQEIDFWNKIIGGLGRVVAGGVGLNQDLDVGGAYKEPQLTTAKELNEPTTAAFTAGKAASEEGYKSETDFLAMIDKIKQSKDLDLKTKTDMLRIFMNSPDYIKATQKDTTTETEGTRDTIVTIPAAPVKRGDDTTKARKAVNLNTKDYFPLVMELNKEVGSLETNVPANPKTSDEFADSMTRLLQSWTGKGIVSPQRDMLKSAYEGLTAAGQSPAGARNAMLTDFKKLLMVQFSPSDNWASANSRATMYGLPYSAIRPEMGPDISSAGVLNQAPTVPAPQAAAPTATPQKAAAPGQTEPTAKTRLYKDGKVFNAPTQDVEAYVKQGYSLTPSVKK